MAITHCTFLSKFDQPIQDSAGLGAARIKSTQINQYGFCKGMYTKRKF